KILPNVHASNVDRFKLRNQAEMLFLNSEISHRLSPPPVALAGLIATKHQIEAQGSRVLVILVPDKLTVYAPLIPGLPPGPPEDRLYVNVLDRALRQRSIPVVNLTAALQRAAAEALANNEPVYHPDDTHWNAAGVMAAAKEIGLALSQQHL